MRKTRRIHENKKEPPVDDNSVECLEEDTDSEEVPRRRYSRPTDVYKFFSKELNYGGAPAKPLRRRYKTFVNAASLCGVDSQDEVMMTLLETTFLRDQALLHYQDVVRAIATCADEAIDLLGNRFLGHRAKRVNEEIWDELTYNFVLKKRSASGFLVEYERVLSDLFEQIADLADMRTGPGSDSIIIAKTISAVQNVETSSRLYARTHPKMCNTSTRCYVHVHLSQIGLQFAVVRPEVHHQHLLHLSPIVMLRST